MMKDWADRLVATRFVAKMMGVSLTDKQARDLVAWDFCVDKAADRFSGQQETAREVAEAALAACPAEEARYFVAEAEALKSKGITITDTYMTTAKREKIPDLMARVMKKRMLDPSTKKQ